MKVLMLILWLGQNEPGVGPAITSQIVTMAECQAIAEALGVPLDEPYVPRTTGEDYVVECIRLAP